MSCAISGGASVIDDPAQGFEERGCAVNLVNDDQLADLGAQERVGVRKPAPVGWALQVKIDGTRFSLRSDLPRQRCLADLARPEQYRTWHMPKAILDERPQAAGKHDVIP